MRRFVVPVLAVVVVLSVAGCGSSGSKSTKAQASATTTSAGQTTSSTAVPSFSGSSNSHYCQLAKDVENNSNAKPNADLKASFAKFDSEASQFLSAAPSSIKGDGQTLVDALKKYEQALQKVNFDVTKLNPTDLQFFEDPKVQQASARVEAYNAQVCGVGTTTSSAG